jgi:mRNA export factor
VFAVNSISFHNPFGTFATAGADGRYTFWDKDAKQRLKQFERCSNTLTAGDFNQSGTIYAYALGYDWSKGVEFAAQHKAPNGILLHGVQEAEIKKKDQQAKGFGR